MKADKWKLSAWLNTPPSSLASFIHTQKLIVISCLEAVSGTNQIWPCQSKPSCCQLSRLKSSYPSNRMTSWGPITSSLTSQLCLISPWTSCSILTGNWLFGESQHCDFTSHKLSAVGGCFRNWPCSPGTSHSLSLLPGSSPPTVLSPLPSTVSPTPATDYPAGGGGGGGGGCARQARRLIWDKQSHVQRWKESSVVFVHMDSEGFASSDSLWRAAMSTERDCLTQWFPKWGPGTARGLWESSSRQTFSWNFTKFFY